MEENQKIKIALVRGDSLNEWEGKLWENLDPNFSVQGFCAQKNLYNISGLNFPVERLPCTSDNFFINNSYKYTRGIFQKMKGLESKLKDYDIAHTAEVSYFFTSQAIRAKQLNPRLKVVATVWDNSFGRFEYNYWPGFGVPPAYWRKKINAIIQENVAHVDLFLAVTDYSACMLLDYGVQQNKIRILTPAVIPPPVKDMSSVLESLKVRDGQFFLSVCRMIKEKGIYDILYAWRMYIKEAGKDEKLVCIGNGKEKNNLTRLVYELGLESTVLFVSSMPNSEVRNLSRHAKGLVLASLPGPLWQEQFGYVLVEAITAGCPVISTYSGAIPEVIENAGLLFSPGNPVDLKNKLVQFNDSLVYQELKNNGLRVKEKFAVEHFRNKLVNVYQELYG